MPRVSLTINGQDYDIACEAGQEESVRALGRMVDEKVASLVSSLGHAGEARLLVMAALLLGDEVQELKKDITRIRAETDALVRDAEEKALGRARREEAMALKTLDEAARRMESIAKRIEAT